MNIKEISTRFFEDDIKFAKKIALTDEEVKVFSEFEWIVLCNNALRQINGSWSRVEVIDREIDDETEDELLICRVSCGVCDEDGRSYDSWDATYNRKTQKFNNLE